MSDTSKSTTSAGRRSLLLALPLIGFAGLAVLFGLRLEGGDPSRIPSALIGHPAPQTALPPLAGLISDGAPVPGLDTATFKGKISVVNVWASWCVPCHDEAPLLTELAKDKRLQLIGINYKDTPDNARRFLGRYGNPFGAIPLTMGFAIAQMPLIRRYHLEPVSLETSEAEAGDVSKG